MFLLSGYLPKQRSLARNLQRKRKASFGETVLPKTWADFDDVPEKFQLTNDGSPFLSCDEVIGKAGERVLGFISPSLSEVLRGSSEWSIDGTFDITRWTLFSQVRSFCLYLFKFVTCYFQCWVVLGRLGSVWIPCAWYLLPSKETLAYKTALLNLKDKMECPGPEVIHLDFEKAGMRIRIFYHFYFFHFIPLFRTQCMQ